MARNRMIKPKFWEDIKVGKLSRDARLLYIAMWNFADDMGVLPAESVYIKSKCFPYDQIQLQQFEKWLTELSQGGFTYQFSHKDENFMYLPNFLKHQRIDRPNYDDLFVEKEALDVHLSTFDDCSTIETGLIDAQVKKSKEEVKDNIVGLHPTTSTTSFGGSPERCEKFVLYFNSVKKSKYQATKKVKKAFGEAIKSYSPEDLANVIAGAMSDKHHKESDFMYVTPEFVLRTEIIERYKNFVPLKKAATNR